MRCNHLLPLSLLLVAAVPKLAHSQADIAAKLAAIEKAVDDKRWFVQRELARLLGQLGTSQAIAPLQVLLRSHQHAHLSPHGQRW